MRLEIESLSKSEALSELPPLNACRTISARQKINLLKVVTIIGNIIHEDFQGVDMTSHLITTHEPKYPETFLP